MLAPLIEEMNPFDQEGSNQAYNALLERIGSQKNEKELDLSLCNLASVPLEAIQTYHKGPTSLLLSHNLISVITPRFTKDMVNLKKLDLSRNLIKVLPDDIGNLQNLNFLDLHLNKLQTLPLSMGTLSQLQYLNVAENPLRDPLMQFLKMDAVKQESENYKINVAHPIVKFLLEVALKASEDSYEDPAGNAPMSRRRNVSFAPESDDHWDENRNFPRSHFATRRISGLENLQRSSRSTGRMSEARPYRGVSHSEMSLPTEANLGSSDKPSTLVSVMKGMFYLLLLLILVPIVGALMVDMTYLKNLAKDSGPTLTSVLEFYEPFHSSATEIYDYVGLNTPLLIKSPALPPYSGFFGTIFYCIRSVLYGIGGFFVFWK